MQLYSHALYTQGGGGGSGMTSITLFHTECSQCTSILILYVCSFEQIFERV